MAEAVLKVVLEKLLAMATAEAQFLGPIKSQIQKLADDLEAMKAFLIDTQARCYHHQGSGEVRQQFNVWVKQVREVSYETEDAIEEFMVRISPTDTHCCPRLMLLKAKHRLASRIQDIRSSIASISERRSAFSLASAPACSRCLQGAMLPISLTDPRSASLWIEETDTVGIDAPKQKLIDWILDKESRLTAMFVVGMGGLGKTTLVKKVFDSHLVTRSFTQRAWITVSESFNEVELLRATLKGFKGAAKDSIEPNKLQMMSNVELVEAIRSHVLGERFIIVLDDVWDVKAWEVLKHALSDSKCGSRILITTRNSDIANSFDITIQVYQLNFLQDKEAWTLFCMKAFRGDEYKGVCPKNLEVMSLSILKKCGGLPLAILAMGGMLSRKGKTLLEWKMVYDSLLSSQSKSDKNLEEGLWKILLLSYNDLPYYLKACYLYLSIFPEDYLIKRTRIVRLWVAERFVEEKTGLTLEEIAEGYLNEFVNRNMIQVVKTDHFNSVTYFRIHDTMREMIQLKSKEEALVEVLDNKHVTIDTKARRMSIHDGFEGLLENNKRVPYIWSVLLFTTSSANSLLNRKLFRGFRRLRVVDLENARISEFPEHLIDLIHLRYLSLRNTEIRSMLPETIGKLKNLEILDLKRTNISSLPVEILQLKQLRQLLRDRFDGRTVPIGIGCLTKLEKLGSLEVYDNRGIINEMGMLVELRKLRLRELRGDIGSDVCASVTRLTNLRVLYMSSQSQDLVVDLSSILNPPQFLQRVFLSFGLTALPNWISSLNYLVKLVLEYSNLQHDPLTSLQDLPSLIVLELSWYAYSGSVLCCSGTGYPKLKNLELSNLPNLESVELPNGAMPELREMGIVTCGKLKMVPQGIENLKKLKCLRFIDMPTMFFQRLKRDQGEDSWKVQHVPEVTHSYLGRDGWVTETT